MALFWLTLLHFQSIPSDWLYDYMKDKISKQKWNPERCTQKLRANNIPEQSTIAHANLDLEMINHVPMTYSLRRRRQRREREGGVGGGGEEGKTTGTSLENDNLKKNSWKNQIRSELNTNEIQFLMISIAKYESEV